MTVVDEFREGVTLVVGTIRCARVWRAHDDGTLSGVTYPQPWVPGENIATCVFAGTGGGPDGPRFHPDGWRGYGQSKDGRAMVTGPVDTRPHTPGALSCTCGFHAYHAGDESRQWLGTGGTFSGVQGVVRMYGRMARGSKGIRAEKAAIVALVAPPWVTSPPAGADRRAECARRWSAVLTRYPVPVYLTADEALTAHPLHVA